MLKTVELHFFQDSLIESQNQHLIEIYIFFTFEQLLNNIFMIQHACKNLNLILWLISMPEHSWICCLLAHFTFHGSFLIPVICHYAYTETGAPPVSETDVCVYRTASESHTLKTNTCSIKQLFPNLLHTDYRISSPSSVFPLTSPPLTALCCKYKTQAADCQQRLPWIHTQRTHTLSKTLAQWS